MVASKGFDLNTLKQRYKVRVFSSLSLSKYWRAKRIEREKIVVKLPDLLNVFLVLRQEK